MDGTIFDIQRCCYHDGPGIRTTVFFKGCQLRCAWCHNPESFVPQPQLWFDRARCTMCGRCVSTCPEGAHHIAGEEHRVDFSCCIACGRCLQICPSEALGIYGRQATAREIWQIVESDRRYYENSGGGVTFSGGEPTLQPEFLQELAALCHVGGIHTALETNGFAEEAVLGPLLEQTDLILLDYKHHNSEQHKHWTGAGNEAVYRTLEELARLDKPVILRLPIIPGVNDCEAHFAQVRKLCGQYANIIGCEILPYHNHGASKWERLGMVSPVGGLPNTSEEQKLQWRRMLP